MVTFHLFKRMLSKRGSVGITVLCLMVENFPHTSMKGLNFLQLKHDIISHTVPMIDYCKLRSKYLLERKKILIFRFSISHPRCSLGLLNFLLEWSFIGFVPLWVLFFLIILTIIIEIYSYLILQFLGINILTCISFRYFVFQILKILNMD